MTGMNRLGCTAETRDAGQREGITTGETQRIKELEREVSELHKTNEILKFASAFCPGGTRSPRAGQLARGYADAVRQCRLEVLDVLGLVWRQPRAVAMNDAEFASARIFS